MTGTDGALAGKIAVVTTISAAFSATTMFVIQWATNSFDISVIANAIVAGLVGVSAACSVIELWGAMLIGIISCLVYLGASKALVAAKIDDALDAFPIHGKCLHVDGSSVDFHILFSNHHILLEFIF